MAPYPKKVMTTEYRPGKTMIAGVVELRNEIGASAEAVSAVALCGVDLLASETYLLPGEGRALWSFFGVAGPSTSLTVLEESLKASRGVVNCQLRKSEGGLLSDRLSFPIRILGDQRGIVLPVNVLRPMLARLRQVLGTGGDALLYGGGIEVGEQSGKEHMNGPFGPLARKFDPEVLGIYSALGWGTLQVVEAAPNLSRVVVSVGESFESVEMKASSPNCHFTRGVMAGYFGVIMGRQVTSTETKCIAMGAPACEFVLE